MLAVKLSEMPTSFPKGSMLFGKNLSQRSRKWQNSTNELWVSRFWFSSYLAENLEKTGLCQLRTEQRYQNITFSFESENWEKWQRIEQNPIWPYRIIFDKDTLMAGKKQINCTRFLYHWTTMFCVTTNNLTINRDSRKILWKFTT